MANLKIFSYNAKGLDDFPKRNSVFLWLKNKEPDIVLLQEAHSTKNIEKKWCKEWGARLFSAMDTQMPGEYV